MLDTAKHWLGFGEEDTAAVIWADRKEWDECMLPYAELPDGAVPRNIQGDPVYFLIRGAPANGDGKYSWSVFPTVEPSDQELTPSDVVRQTHWPLVARVFKPQKPKSEVLEKGLIIFTMVAGFVFLFLLVAMMIGD